MLLAKVAVKYENGWTGQLESYDIYGEWPASTFHGGNYLGLLYVSTTEFEDVLQTISTHPHVDSVDVIRRNENGNRTTATLLQRETIPDETPMQMLLQKSGFLPLRPTRLENGRQTYDLLFEDHDHLADAVEMLSSFGAVSTESITQTYDHDVVPSGVEWQELLGAITPSQRRLYLKAVEEGYFDIPRSVTLEELVENTDITKATASQQLRRVHRHLSEFLATYL